MRSSALPTMFVLCLAGAIGCSSAVQVKKETPAAKSLADYQKIWIGWLDMRPDDYEKYGFESAEIWRGEIARFNTNGVRVYLKEHIGDRLLGTAETPDATPPAEADLVIKLPFDKIVQNHDGWGGLDEMHLTVEMVDPAAGQTVYQADMLITNAAAFPRNWKSGSFDGRVDNEVWNLAGFLAEKLE